MEIIKIKYNWNHDDQKSNVEGQRPDQQKKVSYAC